MAEWLRRVPAKYMGFPRESSNLSGDAGILFYFFFIFFTQQFHGSQPSRLNAFPKSHLDFWSDLTLKQGDWVIWSVSLGHRVGQSPLWKCQLFQMRWGQVGDIQRLTKRAKSTFLDFKWESKSIIAFGAHQWPLAPFN